ncbi:MAG TPA: hypothetical protein VES20_10480, partial [Bryobacteraceae bacterium]|nr:hypothetical protein [Bryobacteraceae bacterium]
MRLASVTRLFSNTAPAVFAAAVLFLAVKPSNAQMNDFSRERIEFTVDVAEDMNLFVVPGLPVGGDPGRGAFFVTEGKILPAYTIPGTGGDQFDPRTALGSLGTWFCKGTFLVKGSEFANSAMAVLT